MSKTSSAKGIYALLSQFAVFGCAFLVFLILVRVFDTDVFGTWVLYQTFMTFAEMARMGFIQNGVVKFMTERPHEKPDLLASVTLLNLGMGIFLWLIFWGLSFPLSALYQSPLLIDLAQHYGFVVISWGFLRLVEYVLMAEQNFRMIFWLHCTNGVLYVALIAGAVLTDFLHHPVMVIWAQSLAAVAAITLIGWQTKRYFQWGKIKRALLLELAKYGRYTMGTSLGSTLLQRLDVLMLGFFTGPGGVALYNIGTKLTNYLEIPLRALSIYIFPQLAETHKRTQGAHTAHMYEQTVGIALFLVVIPTIFLFVFSEWTINLIAGPAYVDAAPVLRIFLLLSLIKPWGRIGGVTMDAIGKPRLNFRLVWISLGLNLGWNLLFIPWLGVVGAAIATVLSMTITTLLGQFALRRHLPFSFFAPLQLLPTMIKQVLSQLKAGKLQPNQWLSSATD